jgi:hypothetical protein
MVVPSTGWRLKCDGDASGHPALELDFRGQRHPIGAARITLHVELKNSRNHDDRLGPMPVFEQCKPERFGAVDEQATTTVLLILDNPIAAAVLADEEEMRSGGRFLLAHDTAP